MNTDSMAANQLPTLLVGQGIAGTLMARRFEQAGLPFMVVDAGQDTSSSKAAAGIINPVTGRHMVKSWRFDDLLPELLRVYKNFEQLLGAPLLTPSRVLRVLPSPSEENKWNLQAHKPGYESYIKTTADPDCWLPLLQPVHAFGEIRNAFLVNWPILLELYRRYLQKRNLLLDMSFEYSQLTLPTVNDHLLYDGKPFRRVIFCEGSAMRTNPWFKHLPMEAAKGEALLIRIPGARIDAILKHRLLIAPWRQDVYWAGSNYERGAIDPSPTPKTRKLLEEKLNQILSTPIEIVDHIAGIRPTVKDRRPLIGTHPEDSRLVLFNGLGTKGSSLAPYWSDHLMNHLVKGQPLDSEVDLLRFQNDAQ